VKKALTAFGVNSGIDGRRVVVVIVVLVGVAAVVVATKLL
jgi:hypothetical protein